MVLMSPVGAHGMLPVQELFENETGGFPGQVDAAFESHFFARD
jgi:hypothetical protein